MPKLIILPTTEIINKYVTEEIGADTLAATYGVSKTRIYNLLIEHGIKRRTVRRNIPTDITLIKQWYSIEHLPSTEIARRLGITFPTVIRRLRDANIPVRGNHDHAYDPDRIKPEDLPFAVRELQKKGGKLTGIVTCPICKRERRRTIFGINNKSALNEYTGLCRKCSEIERTIPVDINEVKRLYYDDRKTVPYIARHFNVSTRCMRSHMATWHLKTRPKGLIRVKQIKNKGTLDNPSLGDICRGTNIGLLDPSYYVYVECPKCEKRRWQVKNHIGKSPLCRECSMRQFGVEHRGEKAPCWNGGTSFLPYPPEFNHAHKELIRERDNYTCQLCGFPQNGHRLAVHHIDYNKNNMNDSNLISLCQSPCHNKTNGNRVYWKYLFQAKILSKTLALPMPYS